MNQGDILLKKWCFGIGRAKPRKTLQQGASGDTNIVISYPKYRTIALVIESAEKKGKQWHVKGKQYASLTGDPKSVEMVFDQKGSEKRPYFMAGTQKRPFHLIPVGLGSNAPNDEGMPPVGSLISVNKKHGLVVEVGRNQLTVFVNGKYENVVVKPGSIRWTDDKLLKSLGK
tara:strand:- start:503 stop:1018 length:516 start_codon:yes stop_codon:yes gene_type:complete